MSKSAKAIFLIISLRSQNSYGNNNTELSYSSQRPLFQQNESAMVVPLLQDHLSDMNPWGHKSRSQNFEMSKNLKGVGYVLSIVELCKAVKQYVCYKKWLKNLSYEEFMTNFAYLLALEEQIARMQDLLHKSSCGTLPERVSARIYLVRSSLTGPYGKVADVCKQSYFECNFDKIGQLIWHEDDCASFHYKNFYKKVPQNFKDLAYCSKKKLESVKYVYSSNIAGKSENPYNQTLLDIVYAGTAQNFPLLKELCRKYYDVLVEKLYQYYINQKVNQYYNFDESGNDMIYVEDYKKNYIIDGCYEKLILQEWYQQEMALWLCLHEQQNSKTRTLFFAVVSDQQVLDLPGRPDYRFILLKAFLDKTFSNFDSELLKDLFLPCGILKKYKNHPLVKEKLDQFVFYDKFFCKVINFSLAICEKELDEVTQKAGKLLLRYVSEICEIKNPDLFVSYKNKIVVLYDALSYKIYDLNILEI